MAAIQEGQYTRVVYELIKDRAYVEAASHLEAVLEARRVGSL